MITQYQTTQGTLEIIYVEEVTKEISKKKKGNKRRFITEER